MATATMITISVHDTAIHTLPADLEERLNKGSPTASPDQLAEALAKHTERAAKLRSAHLDAVRDRAARESQRASEAAARKLRLHHQHVDKIQRKLLASEVKANAKKEKAEAERDARKQKREEMAEAVAEARREATKTREARGAVLLAAERAASAKYSKTREALVAKSHWQVKHAIAVAAAQKEKERRNAVASFERLTERLELAAGRRAMGSGDAAGTSSSSSSTTSSAASSPKSKGGKAPTTWQSPSTSSHPGAVRARVLNDDKVASAMKRKLFEASMDKAATKRAAILEGIKSKAGAENARVASVVASNMAKVAGTDAATVTSKAALYERLCKADVARLQNLKSRHGAASHLAHKHGDTVSVIVIHVDKKARMPPPALSLRLNTVHRTLLATAAARQAGAAARRAATRAAAANKHAKAAEKRAAARARVGVAAAKVEAKITSGEARSLVTLGLARGFALAGVAKAAEKQAAAAKRRAAADAATTAAGAAAAKRVAAAAERRTAKLRATSKVGVAAVRAAANKGRRDAVDATKTVRAAALSARQEAAASARATILAARVALAKKSITAKHPKQQQGEPTAKEAVAVA